MVRCKQGSPNGRPTCHHPCGIEPVAGERRGDKCWLMNAGPDAAPALTERAGQPLFRGIRKEFGLPINDGTLAASPGGRGVALVFRWSNRIDIYGARPPALQRSAAGPVVTRVSFGVGQKQGVPVFTLGEGRRTPTWT